MKKLLFSTILIALACGCKKIYGQGEMITSKTFIITRDGRQAEEIKTYSTKFDSILKIEDEKIFYIVEDEKHYIDLDYHTLIDITVKNDEKNKKSRKMIEELHQQNVKKLELGRSVGWFIAGTTFIFLAQPISNGITRNMDIGKNEDPKDFEKRVNRTYNAVYWSFTGLGAIFEVAGFSKVVKVASGARLKWGITNNGATITYRFPK